MPDITKNTTTESFKGALTHNVLLDTYPPPIQLRPHHFWTYTSNLTTVVNSVLKFMISGTTVMSGDNLFQSLMV
jgi:hypothetical protein